VASIVISLHIPTIKQKATAVKNMALCISKVFIYGAALIIVSGMLLSQLLNIDKPIELIGGLFV
jgi:hypothetical protein